MLQAALECSSIDLMSVHAYVGDASTWDSMMPGYGSQAAAHNKVRKCLKQFQKLQFLPLGTDVVILNR
jgi:hypothetical protein